MTGTPVVKPLATGLGFVIATAAATDGGLYYLTRSYSGVLGEIQPVPEPRGLAAIGATILVACFRPTRKRAIPLVGTSQ